MSDLSPNDRGHLERAAELARRGWGRVHPNPMVGCVLVKDGERIAEDWHAEFGGPHAEIRALTEAGDEADGATAYVSLEPCAHQGKTPPCTRALIRAGVTRVVFGAADPGVDSGGGAERLREAGIAVLGPVWSRDRARSENPGFFHTDSARPWTVLKLAVSIDGAIAERPGTPTPLSGDEAWERTHHLRAGVDAILVGAGTVRSDAPRLTARGALVPREPPARVILDPGDAWIRRAADTVRPGDGSLLDPAGPPVWIAATRPAPDPTRVGAEFSDREGGPQDSLSRWRWLRFPANPDGRVDPVALMRRLREAGIRRLLCEGGAEWARTLCAAGLVDRLVLVVAPRTLGPEAVSAFPLAAERWEPAGIPERLGRDFWCTWDRREPDAPQAGED